MRIILASASPRRKELLEQIGIVFEIIVSHAEEVITESDPGKVVEELSCQKAEAVMNLQEGNNILVIGADTVVAVDDEILGKPADDRQAKEMLHMLSGRSHGVYTGVTLLYRNQEGRMERKCFHEKTEVKVCEMTADEISEYVATGDCKDKAGAYGIQGFFARYVQGIEGDYNNVVGLPVCRLYQEGKDWLYR